LENNTLNKKTLILIKSKCSLTRLRIWFYS